MNLKIVSFELGGELYGMKVYEIEEILRVPEIEEIPNTQKFIEGVINRRGNVVPVINIANKFFLDEKQIDDDSRIIVIDIGEESVGILVDKVNEVIKINDEHIEEPPDIYNGIPKEAFIGVYNLKGRMLILLEVRKVLEIEGD